MSQHIGGDRYVLYLKPAMENIDALDKSLADRIIDEAQKFLTIWNPESLFDKCPTDRVGQLKKDRSVMRAFASWWNGGDVHVLLILQVYKKAHEDSYWADLRRYDTLAQQYHEELEQRQAAGELQDVLENLRDHDDFYLQGPESV